MRLLAVFLWIVAVLVICARSPLLPWLSLKVLEHQVKSNIDPTELQRWATNMLAHYPYPGEKHFYYDFNGTNLPAGLKKVKGYNHAVIVWGGREPNVWVFCGSKGGPFLAVGSPTFTPHYRLTMISWKPGIYFVGWW
jgi:hypothetical protein